MLIRSSSLLALLLGTALLPAQEKYTIKLKHSVAGSVSERVQESTKKEDVSVTGPDGNVIQEKKQVILESYKFREETLAKEGGKQPTKVQRTYTEATRKTEDGPAEKLPFHGQKVLIEMKGDSYHFQVDGKELVDEEAGHLTQTFRAGKPTDEMMDKILLPGKPVAEGESWKIDSKAFLSALGEGDKALKTFDQEKAKIAGKLVKAYKKDGKQFGVLEYTVLLPMSKLEGMFPCKEGSRMEMKITVDGCIDGTIDADSTTFTTMATGSAEVLQDDKPTGVIVKFDIKGEEKSTSAPAKK